MLPEDWQKIKLLFNEAVELPPGERETFFTRHSSEGTTILSNVRQLIDAEKLDHFATPVANLTDLWQPEEIHHLIGKSIGSYTIADEIGRGGMGIVFRARRETEDFSQTVALKLLKRGMDSDAMLRRFRHERQILASLDHPNIARLIDGGISEDGLPFFAMEYVGGEPIDVYCKKRNLGTNDRIKLFLQVCSAVSFAHSRLVVHRDLKPTNILVTDAGVVKLLDFGIAKILSEDDLSRHTVTSLGMMTPAYASPEQVRGEMVSTASDIYSLGLILYELLTEQPAYTFPSSSPEQIARVICELEPTRPSSVVEKQTGGSTSETGYRTGRAARRTRSLRGDLDTIILKALRKEPLRRYASVEQLSGDLQRHMDGLPVIARPDTFSYRLEKFVSRNRIAVVAGAIVFLTLVGGIAATTWQAYRAEEQRRISEQRFTQVRQLANNIVFKYYDEAEKLPNSTGLREMLVADSVNYFDSLAQDTNADEALKSELARAYIRIGKVLGRAYFSNLGDVAGAIKNYRKGIALLEPIDAASGDLKMHSDLINAYSDLAIALRREGTVVESNEVLNKAITYNEDLVRQNPDDVPLSLRLATAYILLGDSLPVGQTGSDNIPAYRHAIEVSENILKCDDANIRANNLMAASADRIATNLTLLARIAADDDDTRLAADLRQEAIAIGERDLKICEKILSLEPRNFVNTQLVTATRFNYGTLLFEAGHYDQALQIQLEAEAGFRDELNNDKDNSENKLLISSVLSAISNTRMRLGQRREAQRVFEESIVLIDSIVARDPENFDYRQKRWESKFNFADELVFRGDIPGAKDLYEKASTEIDRVAREKDAAYGESLKGFYLERMGNADLRSARVAAASEKTQMQQHALRSYETALEIWEVSGAQSILGIKQPARIDVLRRKIARLAS